SLSRAEIEGVIFTEPTRRQVGDVDDTQARVQGGEAIQDFAGGVCRAVINYDDFQIRIVLAQNRLQRLFDVALFVARRDDDGDHWNLPRSERRNVFQKDYFTMATEHLGGKGQPQ